jgi:hypothetical protein
MVAPRSSTFPSPAKPPISALTLSPELAKLKAPPTRP